MKGIFGLYCLLVLFGATAQPKEDTLAIRQQLKGNKIEFQTYGDMELYRVRDKVTNKWGLYGVTDSEEGDKGMVFTFETYITPVCDEIFWDAQLPVVIARQGKKIALITAFNEKMQSISPQFEYDDYRSKKQQGKSWLLVKKDNRWGAMDPLNPGQLLVVFPNENDVPLKELNEEESQRYRKAYLETEAGLVRFSEKDPSQFKGRHKTTGKWGLFQVDGEKLLTLAPMEFDSVSWLQEQNLFIYVFKGKKQGVYLQAGRFAHEGLTVPAEFDELKTVVRNNIVYLAGRDEKQWGWINWLNGDMESDFNAPSFAELPEPTYEQSYGED